MTKEKAEYLQNKYKTFITVWQTSRDIYEVRNVLAAKGWTTAMENIHSPWQHQPLRTKDVKNYARRLRKKGIKLNDLYEPYEQWQVDYDALKEHADTVGK